MNLFDFDRMIIHPHHYHRHPQISIQEVTSDQEEEQTIRQLPSQQDSERDAQETS